MLTAFYSFVRLQKGVGIHKGSMLMADKQDNRGKNNEKQLVHLTVRGKIDHRFKGFRTERAVENTGKVLDPEKDGRLREKVAERVIPLSEVDLEDDDRISESERKRLEKGDTQPSRPGTSFDFKGMAGSRREEDQEEENPREEHEDRQQAARKHYAQATSSRNRNDDEEEERRQPGGQGRVKHPEQDQRLKENREPSRSGR